MNQTSFPGSRQPREQHDTAPHRGQDLMVQEYISAARARLEATNASLPNLSGTGSPPPKSSESTSSAPTSSGNHSSTSNSSLNTSSSSNNSSTYYPETSAHSATYSSGTVPPRRPPFHDTSQRRGMSNPTQTGPGPNRAPRGEWPLTQRPRPPPQFSQGPPPRSTRPRNNNFPLFGRQVIRGASDYQPRQRDLASAGYPGRGQMDREGYPIPAHRGHHGSPMEGSSPKMNSGTPGPYFAPHKIRPVASPGAPPHVSSTLYMPADSLVARPSVSQAAQTPSVPVNPEEPDRFKSFHSSAMNSSFTDLSQEAGDDERPYSGISDFLAGYDDSDSLEPINEPHSEGHIREASIGQIQRPFVTQVSNLPQEEDEDEVQDRSVPIVAVEGVQAPGDPSGNDAKPIVQGTVEHETNNPDREHGPDALGLWLQMPDRFVSRESIGTYEITNPRDTMPTRQSVRYSRSRSPLVPVESRFSQSVTQFGTAPAEAEAPESSDSPPLGERGVRRGSRKPQSLDPAVLIESDTRASTTSLKGLILRNMRLASNLERGVTSSKFGLDWIINAQDTNEKSQSRVSQASMLDEFPSTPPQDSPQVDQGLLPLSAWAHIPEPETPMQEEAPSRRYRRKQYCGLPLWAFVAIIIALALLIVAAIIIPVVLVVLPQQS